MPLFLRPGTWRRRHILAFGWFVWLCTGMAVAADDSAVAPPTTEQQQKVTREIDRLYKGELSAPRGSPTRAVLAKKLLKTAGDSKEDLVSRYVLLQRARTIAAESGDTETALAAAKQLADSYAIDGGAIQLDTVSALARSTTEGFSLLVDRVDSLVDVAVAADRYDAADRLASQAIICAQRSRDSSIIARADAIHHEVAQIRAALEAQQKMTANAKASDADKSLAAGKFYCFMKGQWEKGLPSLADGSDAKWKALAREELQHSTDPLDKAALAEHWWKAAVTEKDLAQRRIHAHAAAMLTEAAPSLSGIAKLGAEKHIVEFMEAEGARRPMSELLVDASIDGNAELHITPKGIYWKEFEVDKPGIDDPIFINEKPWTPKWGNPAKRGTDVCESLPLPIGKLGFDLKIEAVTRERGQEGIDPRDPVTIKTEGGEQIVRIPDGQSGSRWYRIKLWRKR
jgi:hypothetical protein